ncbi:hypothetical protein ABNM51_28735, partial [Pseudomonas syringae]
LFGVNPHQYWLPAHDGNFWDSGLQPLSPTKTRKPPKPFWSAYSQPYCRWPIIHTCIGLGEC